MNSTSVDYDDGGAIFEVGLRNGVWQVTCDGVFYGHYRGRGSAIQAARDAAGRPSSRKTAARVVICDDDQTPPSARRF